MQNAHAADQAVSTNQTGLRSRSARAASPPVRQRKPMKPTMLVDRHHIQALEKNTATAAAAAIRFSSTKAAKSAYRPTRRRASRKNQRAPCAHRSGTKYGQDSGLIVRPQSRTGMSYVFRSSSP